MKLPGAPAGRLERTETVVEGNTVTKYYINHKTGQMFHYTVERDRKGNVMARTWYSDINPRTKASVIPPPDRTDYRPEKKSMPKEDGSFKKVKRKFKAEGLKKIRGGQV